MTTPGEPQSDAAAVDAPELGPTFRYYPFAERPESDSCWAVHRGPDGRVYAACCVEKTGGGTATVVRYDPERDALAYLFEVDEATGDRRDSGRATQCKIHYSFAPDADRGILYAATHLSGPPAGERSYNPFAAWHDPRRAFRGSYLIAFDTGRDEVVGSELMIPREGCRCLCFDPRRRCLYALTFPRDHFVRYDLERRELTDLGRLGSVNGQTIFTDGAGRAHTFDDRGRLVRYDPDAGRLETLPHVYPHDPCQSPWHGVLYDAVADPETGAIYMVSWRARPRLARYWPDAGSSGELEDLGPLTAPWPGDEPLDLNLDHVGGLVFGADRRLYYAKAHWLAEPPERRPSGRATAPISRTMVCRFDPSTGGHEALLALKGGAPPHHYVSSGAADDRGDLFFGKGCTRPAGLYRVSGLGAGGQAAPRLWG